MRVYLIWAVGCSVLFVFGTYAWFAKKPVSFWTINQKIQVSNIKKYNRAVAKLWFVFAAGLAVLGLPLMAGQNSAWIVITILGAMFWAIAFMIVYTRIEKKYRIYES